MLQQCPRDVKWTITYCCYGNAMLCFFLVLTTVKMLCGCCADHDTKLKFDTILLDIWSDRDWQSRIPNILLIPWHVFTNLTKTISIFLIVSSIILGSSLFYPRALFLLFMNAKINSKLTPTEAIRSKKTVHYFGFMRNKRLRRHL